MGQSDQGQDQGRAAAVELAAVVVVVEPPTTGDPGDETDVAPGQATADVHGDVLGL
jgi:hypothetical protein